MANSRDLAEDVHPAVPGLGGSANDLYPPVLWLSYGGPTPPNPVRVVGGSVPGPTQPQTRSTVLDLYPKGPQSQALYQRFMRDPWPQFEGGGVVQQGPRVVNMSGVPPAPSPTNLERSDIEETYDTTRRRNIRFGGWDDTMGWYDTGEG